MIADIRVVERNGQKILQKLTPANVFDIDEEGYIRISFENMQWKDICEVKAITKMVNMEPNK